MYSCSEIYFFFRGGVKLVMHMAVRSRIFRSINSFISHTIADVASEGRPFVTEAVLRDIEDTSLIY